MPPDLSVVIPIYNESPNVRQLHAELTATLEAWGRPYEIVAVDDGSRDDSFQILSELHAADPRLRVIRFRRNFGQTAAFAAGFAHARGAIIVTSDGDLQNDPRDIPALVAELERGADIVCGWRRDRKDTWLTRRAAVDARQPADLGGDRRPPARLRLLAEGLPRRGRQAAAPLRRDAPVHPGHRQRDRRPHHRAGSEPPRPPARHVEVRPVPHRAGGARPADGEVPARLLEAAAPDLRPGGAAVRRPGRADPALAGGREVHRPPGHRRPAAAAVRHPAGVHRRAAGHDRPARRDAGPHVPRVAEQGDVRGPRRAWASRSRG